MLKHTPSDVLVYVSGNYKQFKMISGNRPLNQKKIARITKDIESGNDMLRDYPIQVKEDGDVLSILDGQHRFFICMKLKRVVFYIIVHEGKTMKDIAKVNSNTEKWKQMDFINCYINQGNEDYKKLKAFIDTYGINIGTSLRLLSTGTPGVEGTNNTLTEKFENGTFEVTHWDAAVNIAEKCKLFCTSPVWRDRGFVIAIYRIVKADKVSIEDVQAAFNKRPEMLVKNSSQKQYVFNLEQVVNAGKQKRIVII